MNHPEIQARRAVLGVAAGLLVLTAGCGSSPALRLHRLPLQAPESPASPALLGLGWEVAMRPKLPAYLDRDEILVDRDQGRVEALPGERWAEPLSEALPRLLLHDLALLRGPRLVWPAPAPADAAVQRRLRVELQSWQAEPGSALLRLQARWTLEDMRQRAAPQVGMVQLEVPLASPGTAGIVQAHRLSLWRLAQRIAVEAGQAEAVKGEAL